MPLQIYHNDTKRLVKAALDYIFEIYTTEQAVRYSFLLNNTYIGYNFPNKQIKQRFMVIYGLSGETNQNIFRTQQQIVLTLQLVDSGEQTTTRDDTDKTSYLQEIFSMVAETGYWMFSAQKLFNENKIVNLLEVSRVEELPTSGAVKINQSWQKTLSFVLDFNVVKTRN
jgi:hypothetical protein